MYIKIMTGKKYMNVNIYAMNKPCFVVSPVKQSYRLSFARVLPPNRLFQELKNGYLLT